MTLKVLLPTEVLVDEPVRKIVAEAENGMFGLLPRHVDFVTALVPGLLAYEHEDGKEELIAVDRGMLAKIGDEVLVSTRNACGRGKLGELRRIIEEQFSRLDERARRSRSAAAQLEAHLVRRFLELQHE